MQPELAGGAVVAELFFVGVLAIVATKSLPSRPAMLSSLVVLLVSLAVGVLAYERKNLPLFLGGTALTGIAAAVGYRGSLEVVTDIAPEDNRAEVISAYFVVGYFGNAVPVIGVGVLTQTFGDAVANVVLTGTVAVLAVVALVTGALVRKRHSSQR